MEISKIFNYKGLIFDLDGTLIDSMPNHVKAWQQTAREYGFEIKDEEIYALGGSASYDIAAHFKSLGNPIDDCQAFVDRKMDIFTSHIDEVIRFEPIIDILKQARKLGIKIAIGTGTRPQTAKLSLENHGLTDYVDAVVTAFDVKNHKPFPDTFLEAARRIGVKPEHCLVFEDGQVGIKAALRGGIDCIEVRRGEIINYFECER